MYVLLEPLLIKGFEGISASENELKDWIDAFTSDFQFNYL